MSSYGVRSTQKLAGLYGLRASLQGSGKSRILMVRPCLLALHQLARKVTAAESPVAFCHQALCKMASLPLSQLLAATQRLA